MASAWSASHNGGLGAEIPAWSRGRASGGVKGEPPEAESFSSIFIQKGEKFSI